MVNTGRTDLESHCAVTDPEMKDGFAASERANTLIGWDLVINEGMEVIGSDGRRIGQVKEIREKDFLLDRRKARDLYVPFGAVAKSDNCIILDVASDKVDDTEWERAPVMGTREDRGVFPD